MPRCWGASSFSEKPFSSKIMWVWLVLVLLTLIFLIWWTIALALGCFGVFEGKYFHPKKSSASSCFPTSKDATAIAEQLGEGRYFHFLKTFQNHFPVAIEMHRGAVYQYGRWNCSNLGRWKLLHLTKIPCSALRNAAFGPWESCLFWRCLWLFNPISNRIPLWSHGGWRA